MKKVNKKKISNEMIKKALTCETAEELLAMAKADGYEMTPEEAEAFFADLSDMELDRKVLARAAGGGCYIDCG